MSEDRDELVEALRREVPTDSDEILILDATATVAERLIVGRRIVAFERSSTRGDDWIGSENAVTLTLDDGSRLRFVGWGHDFSGLNTTYVVADDEAGA